MSTLYGTAELIRLYTEDHLTLRAIAARVGLSASAVWKRLRRAGIVAHDGTWVVLACMACGLTFERKRSCAKRRTYYCSDACYQGTIQRNGATYVQSRAGCRQARRIVACCFALLPEHIVHHHDGDNHNNRVSNLAVFASHADHMRFHRGGDAQPIWDGRAQVSSALRHAE